MRWLLCRSGHLAIVFSINWLIPYVHVYFTILSFFTSYFKLRAIGQITVRIFDIFVVFYLSQEFKMVLSSIVNETKSVRNLRVQSQIGRIILSNVRKRTKASEIGRMAYEISRSSAFLSGKDLWDNTREITVTLHDVVSGGHVVCSVLCKSVSFSQYVWRNNYKTKKDSCGMSFWTFFIRLGQCRCCSIHMKSV